MTFLVKIKSSTDDDRRIFLSAYDKRARGPYFLLVFQIFTMYGGVLTTLSGNGSRNSCVVCTEDFAHHTSTVIEDEIIGSSSALDPITSVSKTKNRQTGIVQPFSNTDETISGFCSAYSLTSKRPTTCHEKHSAIGVND